MSAASRPKGGMALAIVVTLLQDSVGNYALIGIGMVVGGAVGLVGARMVKMTAMPQMVALFNGVGGGSILYNAQWPRMLPDDFRVKTIDGVAEVDAAVARAAAAQVGWAARTGAERGRIRR